METTVLSNNSSIAHNSSRYCAVWLQQYSVKYYGDMTAADIVVLYGYEYGSTHEWHAAVLQQQVSYHSCAYVLCCMETAVVNI